MTVTIDEILVADQPEAWAAAGFSVDGDVCRVGSVRLRLVGPAAGKGVVGWSLRDVPPDLADLDGVSTLRSDAEPAAAHGAHANGVTHIDHIVLLSPDLGRARAALDGIGLEPRRERDGELGGVPVRQVFYRLGDVILEVVGSTESAEDGPSRIWGLTHAVADIDETAAYLGERTGPVKDAVQPGRRITTLRNREIGISVRTALISPHVRA